MIGEMIAAAVGTMAFALLFGVPRTYYPWCGLIGGAGWMVYSMTSHWCSVPEATFFAALLVIFLSRIFAVRERCPVTIFLISGIFPLVPGAGIYWTSYYIVTNQLDQAGETGFMAVKAAAAIVLAIVFIFELPQSWFRFAVKRRKGI